MNKIGSLYIVATPIGNLKDVTARAIEVLKAVPLVVAEDTRHSFRLLQHFGISTPIQALHEHNEREVAPHCIKRLLAGESIALISDAGTPLMSDPGFILVRLAHEHEIPVVPIPGACAAIAAISASGLPTDRFCFEGFLPAKQKMRLARLEALQSETRTLVFYEAPHRVLDTLQDMQTVFGKTREVTLARELTKKFETIKKSQLSELLDFITQDPDQQKGEMVLVVAGRNQEADPAESLETERILSILLGELPLKQAVDLTLQICGGRKNEIYQWALRLK